MADDEKRSGHGKCGAKKRQGAGNCTRPAGWGTDHSGTGRCKFHGGNTPSHRDAASREIQRYEADRLGLAIETTPAQALLDEVREAASNVTFYRSRVAQLSAEQVEQSHVAVQLYNEERKRLVEACQAAMRGNVEERLVRLAEADAIRIAEAQVAALATMGLADRTEEFRAVFTRHLTAALSLTDGAGDGQA